LDFRYNKLKERQKSLQRAINGKMASDIQNVQQILESMAIQNQQTDGLKDGIIRTTKKGGNETCEVTSTSPKENKAFANYKNSNWHTSLLMYNSY
jgi:nitrogen fixation protein FixH